MTTTGAPTISGRPPAPTERTARAASGIVDYVTLLKPRIMVLIVITTVGAMAFAARGLPRLGLLAATVLGMCLESGGASALNHWYDRDIDALMARTRVRPIPSGRVLPRSALLLGLALGVVGVAELAWLVNGLAALWAAAGFVCYVVVYTIWLKRSTPQNIVIGGAAGAIPPLVGWAAVTGQVSASAIALFAIIFLWTPPHFWSLALLLDEEYAAAGVPMLPTVAGARRTSREILAYSSLLAAASLVPVALGTLGWLYAALAIVLAARLLQLAIRLCRAPDDRAVARRLFLFSLLYLAALFAAMGLDRALLG